MWMQGFLYSKEVKVHTYYVYITVKAFLKNQRIQKYHLKVKEDLVPNLYSLMQPIATLYFIKYSRAVELWAP